MLHLHSQNGAVAQSVEQRTENPCVAGSIPAHTTAKQPQKRNMLQLRLFFYAKNEVMNGFM
jgi:hypothetical protein